MTTKIRALPILFLLAIIAATAFIACSTIEAHAAPVARCRTVTCAHGGRTQPHPCKQNVACLKRALRWSRKDRSQLRRELTHRTRVDLKRAIAISSVLFGVSEPAMTCIAWHESGYGAQTTAEPSSGALGPFQWLASSWASTPLGRAGYSRLDPLAASLSTAQRVIIDHGWHEWVTGPGCGL